MQLLLLHHSGRRILVEFSGQDIHTRYGVVKAEDVEVGRKVTTNKGEIFLILRPNIRDFLHFMPMKAKPIFEYDAGMFAGLLGIERGHVMIEAGAGSGGSAIVFANFIYPGKVYSFEVNESFYKVAKENVERVGIDNIYLYNDDVRNAGRYVKHVDSIFLDLRNPDDVVPTISSLLKPGGYLGVYTPIFDSIKPVWRVMQQNGFVDIQCVHLGLERVVVKKYARFEQKHFGFPGFFLVGRRFDEG